MKKLTLSIALSCIILTGCSNLKDIHVPVNKASENRFQLTGNRYVIDNYYWDEYRDTQTDNLYLYNESQYSNGLVPLYDEDGNIAKYNK